MTRAASTANSRYELFRQVMRNAVADSTADYDGLGLFWELPLDELLQASLCGVRLIADEGAATPSCCAHHAVDPAASRSSRSGLIQGLRGEPPFDGSRFPRLPWGGRAVADADVRVIAEWIDDGCPRSDKELAAFPLADTTPIAITQFAVLEGGAGEYLYQRGELKQRMNVDCMSETQLAKLRFAMRELYALNKWSEDSRSYNNLALIHQNHCQHGWERFLPWHRIYLYEFEQALQDHCPDVTMPYWDWTMAQYSPATPYKGAIIPSSFKAFLVADSLTYLGANGVP